MKILKYLVPVLIIMVLLSCSLTVNVPTVETGISQTMVINESVLNGSDPTRVNITMGAGALTLSGGASSLIEGTVIYNVESWKPVISRTDGEITITQKTATNIGIPNGNIKNSWDLHLGTEPIDFSLTTGAYEGTLDMSGIAISKMTVTDGASKSNISFSSLNPVEMSSLHYKTGASQVTLSGLGYANVRDITFDSGVGAYELDFSGGIQKDTNVIINSGMSDVKLVFPAKTNVQVVISGGLGNVDASGTWTIANNTYSSMNNSPLLTVTVNMAVGNLQLIQN